MNKEKILRGEIFFCGNRRMELVVNGDHEAYLALLQSWQKKYGKKTTLAEILLLEAGLGKRPEKN